MIDASILKALGRRNLMGVPLALSAQKTEAEKLAQSAKLAEPADEDEN